MKTTALLRLGIRTLGLLLLCSGTLAAGESPGVRTALLRTRKAPAPANPPTVRCESRMEARMKSFELAALSGGAVFETSGTPSMEPLIHGKVYAVVIRTPFESILRKDILIYMGRPDASRPDRLRMVHRAVLHDSGGWIMSGDNNRWSESWDRVTPDTYVGTVVALYVFPQA